jgi:hypothetical protein
LCGAEISLDKVRAVADVASPETDRELRDQAQRCGVRELNEIARTTAARAAASAASSSSSSTASHSQAPQEQRYLRFNDACRTVIAQLPPASYAELKAWVEARAHHVPSDGETPWDQRCCDALLEIPRSASNGGEPTSPFFVVVHVPLDALVEESGQSTALAGELDHVGLIDSETVRRIA